MPNELTILLLLLAGIAGALLYKAPGILSQWRAFQEWRAAQGLEPASPQVVIAGAGRAAALPREGQAREHITPLGTLKGAREALAEPPGNLRTVLEVLQHEDPYERYRIPLGWHYAKGGAAGLARASLVGDTNHILITGQSDTGKDNLALTMLFSLALLHPPEELQLCLIDGKGLDFAGFQGKAHTWRLAQKPEEIAPAMEALTRERLHRADILRAAGVSKWEEYEGEGLPLLVVYVSELSLLEDATSKSLLAQWLNSELAAGRAFGIRYIVASQTVSNFSTRWRSQISLFLAGFQPAQSQDEPNTGLTTKELQAARGVPPSELPAPPLGAGVFTAVQGRDCITVRASKLDSYQRKMLLDFLPEAPARALQPAPEPEITEEAEATLSRLLESISPSRERQVSSITAQKPSLEPVEEPILDTDTAIPETKAAQKQREKIRKALTLGMSKTEIVDLLGGNRNKAFKLVEAALEEQGKEVGA